MPYILVRHPVEDYAKWKPVFDESIPLQRVYGFKECRLFRSESDPNDLTVLAEVEDLDLAREFFLSEELQGDMRRGGVIGAPEITYLEALEQPVLHH